MKTVEYASSFPRTDLIEITFELGEFMGIPVTKEALKSAYDSNKYDTVETLAIFYDPQNHDNVIVMQSPQDGLLINLFVRCTEDMAPKVKAKFLEIDRRIRTEWGIPPMPDAPDMTNDPDWSFKTLSEEVGVKI